MGNPSVPRALAVSFARARLPAAALIAAGMLLPLSALAPALAQELSGDARRLWAECQTCHRVRDGEPPVAPPLGTLFRRRSSDPLPDFVRSRVLHRANVAWTRHTLDRYLTDPPAYVRGMGRCTPGIADAGRRRALIALMEAELGAP
jgi:cytochrome c